MQRPIEMIVCQGTRLSLSGNKGNEPSFEKCPQGAQLVIDEMYGEEHEQRARIRF
jgi:hypothetical protein